MEGRRTQIQMSAGQVAKNVSYTRDFRGMLASLSSSGLTTGLLSGGINKAISGVVVEMDFLHKHDRCHQVQKCKGNGLYLARHPRFGEGDGLKDGSNISDGAGLLMGKNSPLKNIPVLGWLL